MKKISLSLLLAGSLLAFAGCSNDDVLTSSSKETTPATGEESSTNTKTTTTTTTNKTDKTYKIKVVDIDGEELLNITPSVNTSVLDALKENDLVGYESPYGYSITSIKGSIVDDNWYMASYENGAFASVSVDKLVQDENDEFTFINECWNTVESGFGVMDKNDVLVDRVLYHYAKTSLKNHLSQAKSFTGSDYWDLLTINLMNKNSYDSVFNVDALSDGYKDSIKNQDVTKLTGANFGKYYAGARLLGTDLTAFKTSYQTYLDSLTAYGSYGEYTLPFSTIPAIDLKLTISNDVKNTTYRADTAYGMDGLSWELANLASMGMDVKSELTGLTTDKTYDNSTSLSAVLMAIVSSGENARDDKYNLAGGKDIIDVIFTDYYDSVNNTIKLNKTSTKEEMSSNQAYAALAGYKALRDGNEFYQILS